MALAEQRPRIGRSGAGGTRRREPEHTGWIAEISQVEGRRVHILRSAREIAQMRKAGLLVWEAHQIAAELVAPGVTTAAIDAAIEKFFVEHNAIPLFKGVPGKVPFPAVTCISVNEEVVHGIPGPRELQEGDVVSIDTGCKLDGWCGDAAVTHPVGHVEPEVVRLLEVTRGVLELAIKLMGQKSRWSQVAGEMATYVRDAGFSVVESFVGHGIGREMHEDPQVPNFVSNQLRRNGDFSLEPGLVIAVEPMVNMGTKLVKTMPDFWTQGNPGWKTEAAFRAYDRHHRRRPLDPDRWAGPGEPLARLGLGRHRIAVRMPAAPGPAACNRGPASIHKNTRPGLAKSGPQGLYSYALEILQVTGTPSVTKQP